VLILALFTCIFFAFIMSSMISNIQGSFNPLLGADTWVTAGHFNTFYLAASLVTNFWTYVIAIIVLGLGYWAWIYTQRNNGR
jgi:hypothetical protein